MVIYNVSLLSAQWHSRVKHIASVFLFKVACLTHYLTLPVYWHVVKSLWETVSVSVCLSERAPPPPAVREVNTTLSLNSHTVHIQHFIVFSHVISRLNWIYLSLTTNTWDIKKKVMKTLLPRPDFFKGIYTQFQNLQHVNPFNCHVTHTAVQHSFLFRKKMLISLAKQSKTQCWLTNNQTLWRVEGSTEYSPVKCHAGYFFLLRFQGFS